MVFIRSAELSAAIFCTYHSSSEELNRNVRRKAQKKVYDVLRKGYFSGPDDAADVSDGPEDSIHLVIVSRKFDGRRLKEKNDLIWSQLMQNLIPDEWDKVSLSIGASPGEIKAS